MQKLLENKYKILILLLIIAVSLALSYNMGIYFYFSENVDRQEYLKKNYGFDNSVVEKLSDKDLKKDEVQKRLRAFYREDFSTKNSEDMSEDKYWHLTYFDFVKNLYIHSDKFTAAERLRNIHSELGNMWVMILNSKSYAKSFIRQWNLRSLKSRFEKITQDNYTQKDLKAFKEFISESSSFPYPDLEEKFNELIKQNIELLLKDVKNVKKIKDLKKEETRRLKKGLLKTLGMISISEEELISCSNKKRIFTEFINLMKKSESKKSTTKEMRSALEMDRALKELFKFEKENLEKEC